MAKRLIVTNNPVVAARYAGHSLSWQANYLQVLLAARDAIHQGQKLLMHPALRCRFPGASAASAPDESHRVPPAEPANS